VSANPPGTFRGSRSVRLLDSSVPMCRLFGQHAHPGFDPCEPLCSAENALRFQSHKHPHGWGIGWYRDGVPQRRIGLLAAHHDETFVAAAKGLSAGVVVAHIRDASIGRVIEENTHPFVHGRWLFAHNGTLARFKRVKSVRDALLAEIDPDLRPHVRGETDSERCFYVFLSRLRARAPLDRADLASVRRALAEMTEAVAGIADPTAEKPSSMNFLATDGRVLAACRRGRTLHLSLDAGPRHAFVVASEPIGRSAWEEVPEGGFVGTDDGMKAVRGPLAERTRAA
jgi:predicted glutamine amidotransferase